MFQQRKVLTLLELRRATQASNATLWRWLAHNGGLTSYNHNARFYTLQGIARFNERGFWNHRGRRFSQWGSLTKSVLGLVEQSADGLTATQLSQQLQVPNLRPLLSRLVQEKRLVRQKFGRDSVFFTIRQTTRKKQLRARTRQVAAVSPRALPAVERIVALLVEIIRRPRHTRAQWIRQLARRGVRLRTDEVQAVLDHYQLDLKKGLSSF